MFSFVGCDKNIAVLVESRLLLAIRLYTSPAPSRLGSVEQHLLETVAS